MHRDMGCLRDMALFTAFAWAGNFTRAASELGLPSSTTSRRIEQ